MGGCFKIACFCAFLLLFLVLKRRIVCFGQCVRRIEICVFFFKQLIYFDGKVLKIFLKLI